MFEPSRGEPVAVLEAGSLTAIRTAAATAFATQLLAREAGGTLAIFGAGEQARLHIPALLSVRPFRTLHVWARDAVQGERLARHTRETCGVAAMFVANAAEAAEADVICTLTASTEPVLLGAWVSAGTHVNLVGSSSAGPREADEELVRKSRYFVDSAESARAQASEFLRARAAGVIDDAHVLGEIGDVVMGRVPGRQGLEDITVYKSLGNIAQDLVCAWYLYERAASLGFGTRAEF